MASNSGGPSGSAPVDALSITSNARKRPMDDDAAALAAKRKHTRATMYSRRIAFPKNALLQSTPPQPDLLAISDMRTVPNDIKDCPVVLRLASSGEAIGQFTNRSVKDHNLASYISMSISYGRHNLDAGLALNFSYTQGYRTIHPAWMTQEERENRKDHVKAGHCAPIRLDNYIFKCRTGVKSVNGHWQLSDIHACLLTPGALKAADYECMYQNKPIEEDRNFRSDEWVAMKFTMRSPALHSPKTQQRAWSTQLEDTIATKAGTAHVTLLREMFLSEEVQLVAYFKPPIPAQQWIETDLKRLQDEIKILLPPLSPYCHLPDQIRGDWQALDITLDLPGPQEFNKSILLRANPREPPKTVNPTTNAEDILKDIRLTQIPFKEVFPDVRTAEICLKLSVVREHQAKKTALAPLSSQDAEVLVIQPSVLRGMAQQLLYLIVRIALKGKSQSLPLPKVDTVLQIRARDNRFGGHRFTGRVKALSNNEREYLVSCNREDAMCFMVVVTVSSPQVFQTFKPALSFQALRRDNTFPAVIDPILDELSAKRSLTAINVCTTGQGLVAMDWISADLSREIDTKLSFDIAAGPLNVAYYERDIAQGLTVTGHKNLRRYGYFLDIIRKHTSLTFGKSQNNFLQQATNVTGRHIVVNTCPGSHETETLSWMILGLLLVGHKVLLAARTDSFVDHFAVTMKDRIETFTAIVSRLIQDDKQHNHCKETYSQLYEAARDLKCLRWLPPNEENKLLKIANQFSGDLVQVSGVDVLDLLGDEASNQLLDAILLKSEAAVAACAAGDEIASRLHSEEHDHLVQQYDTRKQIFERSNPTQRKFEYPVTFSMHSRIQQTAHETRPVVPNRGYDSAIQDLHDASETLFGRIVAESDLVFATCLDAQQSILVENFKSTGCILEEAESISQANAMCIWRFPHEWAVSVGDMNRSLLRQRGDYRTECADLLKYSDLQSWNDRVCSSSICRFHEQNQAIPHLYGWAEAYAYGNTLTHGLATNRMHEHERALQFRSVMEDSHVPITSSNGSLTPGSPTFESNYYLKDVDGEGVGHEPDVENPIEAKVIINDATALVAAGVPQDKITVLCYYQAQVARIKSQLRGRDLMNIPVSTVDDFSRKSNEIVLVSLTRSVSWNRSEDGKSFPHTSRFALEGNRLILASTCATHGCTIYGDFTAIMNINTQGRGMWYPIVNMILDAERRLCMLNGTTITDARDKAKLNTYRRAKLTDTHRYIANYKLPRPG